MGMGASRCLGLRGRSKPLVFRWSTPIGSSLGKPLTVIPGRDMIMGFDRN